MFLVGLTGNIASGKSTVRRELELLGARTIDADALAHAVLTRGTPAWREVVDAFGPEVVHPDGSIDRGKLGAIVFADPAQLSRLEAIVHPAVSVQLGLLLRAAREPIVVVEAVKLVEAGLHRYCDAVWVVTAPEQEAKRRLIRDRRLSERDALARLAAQPSLEEKLKHATVVIDNGGSLEATRVQVARAFSAIRPATATDKQPVIAALLGVAPPARAPGRPVETAQVRVRRARPGDMGLLADLLARAEGAATPLARAQVLKRFGRWGYWLAEADGTASALAAWKVENLVAIIRDLWATSPDLASHLFPPLLQAIEQEARALECEVVTLITTAQNDAWMRALLETLDYQPRALSELHPVWRAIAQDELHSGETLYIKRLRTELVTRPV